MYKIGLMGGADEIGRSMLYIEYNKNAIIIDCGMEFPDDLSAFGVKRVVSYGSYIKNNLNKVRGLFITHMHEDHIGGIRRFLDKFNVPIYAEPLTCEFLKIKNSFRDNVRLIPINKNQIMQFGQMKIRPFLVEHSTIKAYGYEIMSKFGNIVVTGDFKLGNSYEDSMNNIKSWGIKEQPLAVLIESTNANNEGYCYHESDIISNIEKVMVEHKEELLIISTFASNMERLKNIIYTAQKLQQDIFIMGRNMEVAVEFLIKQDIISNSRIRFIEDDKINVPDNAIILSTGCQGEEFGGLYRLSKRLDNKEKKVVLFSSSVIPGNEKSVNDLKIQLLKHGFRYIEGDKLYHTSGHAKQDELKCVIEALNPQYVIPVHGDYIKQLANKDNAIACGVKEKNILVVENNSIIKLKRYSYEVSNISDSLEYITNNGIAKPSLIESKKTIAQNGMFIYTFNGRYIKFSSIGIPENCKLNKVGRNFVQVYLSEFKGSRIVKSSFKERCLEYLSEEVRNENNIPYIEIIDMSNKTRKNQLKPSNNDN